MTRRSLLVATAATAALALCAASGTAAAATTATAKKAVGRGTSNLSLLHLAVGGHDISLADIALVSDTVKSPRVSSVSVTPVTVDGTSYGKQTVNQSTSPKTVAPVSLPGALAAFAQLSSPAIDVTATSGPSNHAGASSLGDLKVLGLPVSLAGALEAASAVSSADGAQGIKTVTIDDLALPSIKDILGALGLDLSKLPVGTLDDLVSQLELVTGAINTAQGVVDTAQAAVDSATSDLATKTASLTSANSALTAAQAALATATTTVTGLLATAGLADVAAFQALLPAAQAAVATAQGLVNTAQALLATVTSTLTSAISSLKALILGALDDTPLVSLDSLEVSTRAVVTSASKGGQHAEVVGGTVKGLRVLGNDVLAAALGSSTLDLDGVVTSTLNEINATIATITGTLSSVLSSVPSFPTLDVPAPVVGLLTKTTSVSISDGFGRASTTVQGLSISLPAITLPTALAVPGAASLPGLAGVSQVAGLLSSAPLSLGVLTLRDQAAFSPAVIGGTNTSGTPGQNGHLAGTGLPAGVAALSLLLLAGSLVVRRRLVTVG